MSYRNKIFRYSLYCYMPIVIIFAVIRMLSAFGVLNFLGSTADYILTIVIQIGLLFCLSIFLFAKTSKSKVKDVFTFFKFKKINWKAILIAIVMGIVVYLLNVLITTFFNAFLSAFGYKFSSGSGMQSYPVWLLFVNLFMTAVLPGICEETAHRGLLLNGFSGAGQRKALILSSILFGLLHLNIEQVFYATLIGLLAGYITCISNSIYPAMIIHFMNNTMSVLMGFSSFHKLGLEIGFTYLNSWLSSSPILTLLFMIVLIAALLFLLMFLIKLLFRATTFNQMAKLEKNIVNQMEKEKYLKELEEATNGNDVNVDLNEFSEEDFERIYKQYNEKFYKRNPIEKAMIDDKEPFKLDKITKIMLITTITIVSVLTIFTFIWGII